jgi:hypothetical protein
VNVNVVTPAFAVPVVLLSTRVTGRDEYGNDVREATRRQVAALAVWPRVSDEVTQGRDTVVVGVVAILPYGTRVAATDRVEWDEQVWEVEGEPGVWGPSPFTGNVGGVEVALRRVTG